MKEQFTTLFLDSLRDGSYQVGLDAKLRELGVQSNQHLLGNRISRRPTASQSSTRITEVSQKIQSISLTPLATVNMKDHPQCFEWMDHPMDTALLSSSLEEYGKCMKNMGISGTPKFIKLIGKTGSAIGYFEFSILPSGLYNISKATCVFTPEAIIGCIGSILQEAKKLRIAEDGENFRQLCTFFYQLYQNKN